LAGTLQLANAQGGELESKGRAVYIGGNGGGMQIVNATNPTAPFVSSTYLPPPSNASHSVFPRAIAGNRLVTLTISTTVVNQTVPTNQVQIFDVSNNLSPTLAGAIPLTTGSGLQDYVFPVLSPDGSKVTISVNPSVNLFDISNPASPGVLNDHLPSVHYGLWMGSLLVGVNPLGSELIRLTGVDVGNPQKFTIPFNEFEFESLNRDLYGNSDIVFAPEYGLYNDIHSVWAISVRNTRFPVVLGKYHDSGSINSILTFPGPYIEGFQNLVVLAYYGRIQLISFRNPSSPILLEQQSLDMEIYDIDLDQGYLYVLCETGLLIYQLDLDY